MDIPEHCRHTLTEPVRQKEGNPILELAYMIREEIFGNHNLNRVIMEILKPKIHESTGYLILPEANLFDTYIKTENEITEEELEFRPKNTINLGLSSHFGWGISSYLSANYVGTQYKDGANTDRLKAYTVANIQISKKTMFIIVSVRLKSLVHFIVYGV